MTGRPGKCSGLSLAEVIIAASLLGLILITLIGLAPSALLGLRLVGDRNTAANLALEQLELARAAAFDALEAPSTTWLDPVTVAGTTFRIVRQVRPVDHIPPDRLKAINVRVLWSDRFSHAISFDTFRYCRR